MDIKLTAEQKKEIRSRWTRRLKAKQRRHALLAEAAAVFEATKADGLDCMAREYGLSVRTVWLIARGMI